MALIWDAWRDAECPRPLAEPGSCSPDSENTRVSPRTEHPKVSPLPGLGNRAIGRCPTCKPTGQAARRRKKPSTTVAPENCTTLITSAPRVNGSSLSKRSGTPVPRIISRGLDCLWTFGTSRLGIVPTGHSAGTFRLPLTPSLGRVDRLIIVQFGLRQRGVEAAYIEGRGTTVRSGDERAQ